jgi:hypothetical protein
MSLVIRESVRGIVEYILQQGSLDDRHVSNIRAMEGTIAHSKVQSDNAKIYVEYEKEVLYSYDLDEETARSIATDFRARDIIPVPEGHDIFYLEDERNWSPEYKYVYEKYQILSFVFDIDRLFSRM